MYQARRVLPSAPRGRSRRRCRAEGSSRDQKQLVLLCQSSETSFCPSFDWQNAPAHIGVGLRRSGAGQVPGMQRKVHALRMTVQQKAAELAAVERERVQLDRQIQGAQQGLRFC